MEDKGTISDNQKARVVSLKKDSKVPQDFDESEFSEMRKES